MPALILSFLGRFAPWIAGGVVVLGVALYGWHLHAALRSARAALHADSGTIAQLEAVNVQNRKQLARLTADAAAWQTALTTASTADERTSVVSEHMLSMVANAKPKEDAPVAPVLAGTLAAIAKAQGGGR